MMRTELIQIRIHPDDKKDFNKLAKDKGRSMSELVTDFIKNEIRNWRKQQ